MPIGAQRQAGSVGVAVTSSPVLGFGARIPELVLTPAEAGGML